MGMEVLVVSELVFADAVKLAGKGHSYHKALVVDIEAEDPAWEVKAESSQVCLQCHRVEAWQKCASVITLQKLSESNARAVKTYY